MADRQGDPGAEPRPKKKYVTIVAERTVRAPRTTAFDTLCNLISERTGGYVTEGDPAPHGLGAQMEFAVGDLHLGEQVISFEPPWRRVYELTGAPVVLYQGTTAFTDRGETCLMAWSLVIDPLTDGGSDRFIVAAEAFLDNFADALVARAEAAYQLTTN